MPPMFPGLTRRRWLAAMTCCAIVPSTPAAQPLRRPWPARRDTPTPTLAGLDGAEWRAVAARGQPLLVNFWATWCGPCRDEMRSLEAAGRVNAARGLQVVAVDYRESDETVRRFVDGSGLGLRVVRDVDGAAAKSFGVNVFPSTVAIGRDGRARFTVVGECDWTGATAQRWIDEIL